MKFRLVNYGENELKKRKKSDFFSIDNMNISWKVDNFCSVVKSTLCTKKIQKRTYGDFDDDFFYKNWKKKIFWKSHTWGFQHFFKKKWKINIFYMCLEFIHIQIWTLFFTKIRKMKIYYTSWKFSHIRVLTIFKKQKQRNECWIHM